MDWLFLALMFSGFVLMTVAVVTQTQRMRQIMRGDLNRATRPGLAAFTFLMLGSGGLLFLTGLIRLVVGLIRGQ